MTNLDRRRPRERWEIKRRLGLQSIAIRPLRDKDDGSSSMEGIVAGEVCGAMADGSARKFSHKLIFGLNMVP
jgi:hypothetical protein